MPSFVDPESGSRLPLPRREELDEAARAVYDRHCDPDGGSLAGLRGPGGLRLHSPELAKRQAPVGRYLRFESGIPETMRELAILVVARETDSRFEWAAHEPEALRVGVAPRSVEAIKHGLALDDLDPADAEIIAFGRALMRDRHVAEAPFQAMLDRFGARMLVDLVALMGSYTATAMMLAAFDVQLPPGPQAQLPPADRGLS